MPVSPRSSLRAERSNPGAAGLCFGRLPSATPGLLRLRLAMTDGGEAAAPSTTLRVVPLLRCAGEDIPCPTSQRCSSAGSRTVAESPVARIIGAMLRSRARSSASRSPRLPATIACSSSNTTRRRSANSVKRIRRGEQQRHLLRASSAGCPAGVRAGACAWRPTCRRCASRSSRRAAGRPPAGRGCARRRPRAPSSGEM